MSTPNLTRLASVAAGFMLAHQVAGKALRDAAFFTSWDASSLPLMVLATAAAVVAAVPLFARLLERFGPRHVVAAGFVVSAAAHLAEWALSSTRPWVAAAIYVHVAGLGALLLSGVWSVLSERYDPRGARAGFGKIAAGGTIGGLIGGATAERIAAIWTLDGALLLLAGLHVICAAAVVQIGRAPVLLPAPEEAPTGRLLAVQELRKSPHLRTIAAIVLFSTAAAGVLDFLLKWQVTERIDDRSLFRFFAIFYGAIQVGSFFAQLASGRTLQRLGVGRTISTLPAGVGVASTFALLFPVLPLTLAARAVEAILRGSLFRGAYEILFVPMDATERRRMKTFLDVTCDRAGEALGALIVQTLLLTSTIFLPAELLAMTIGLAALTFWLGRRLDRLYLGVVEQQLVRHADQVSIVVASDVSWTMLDLAKPLGVSRAAPPPAVASGPRAPGARPQDPRLRVLADLRSGDRDRVEGALRRMTSPDRVQIAQVIELLAWDDVVASARAVLERTAPAHVGTLADALLDSETDFAIRRRIPRILGILPSQRALDALVGGLDDARFEVRYQCARAIARLLRKAEEPLTIDRDRMLSVIDRELSLPPAVWQGLRLIDQIEPEGDGDDEMTPGEAAAARNLEHVFTLLGAVLPRDAVRVAFRGLQSGNPGLRGLALEYLEGVLPPEIASKLWSAIEAAPERRREPADPVTALEALRRSAGTPIITRAVTPSGDDAPSQSDQPRPATKRSEPR